jgi:hypothetical protein
VAQTEELNTERRKPRKQNTRLSDFRRSLFSFAPRFEREKTLLLQKRFPRGTRHVRWKGVDYPLIEPEVVDWATVRSAFSPVERILVPVIGIEQFVRLRHAPAGSAVSQM